MKYEETNDLTTVLVEPRDEVLFVLDWICERCHPARPVVLILPVNASQLFSSREHFVALRQLQDERAGTILLVIPGNVGNERLRSWATRQGFAVFATVEAFQQRSQVAHPYAPLPYERQEMPGSQTFAQHGPLFVQQQQPYARRDVQSPTRRAQHISAPLPLSVTMATASEPSVSLPRKATDTDELKRRSSHVETLTRRATGPLIVRDGPTALRIERRQRQDTVMLVLVVLLILGILGGVGFGYLLTLTDHAPQAISPQVLIHVLRTF